MTPIIRRYSCGAGECQRLDAKPIPVQAAANPWWPQQPDQAYTLGRVLHITLMFDFAGCCSPLGVNNGVMHEKIIKFTMVNEFQLQH